MTEQTKMETYREDAIASVFQKKIDDQSAEIKALKSELNRIKEGMKGLRYYLFSDVEDLSNPLPYAIKSDIDKLIEGGK